MFSDNSKNILLLNSYHKGYLWTDEITRGVEDVFRDENVNLHIDYLDTKRFFNPDYLNALKALLERKLTEIQYDAVITSDNNAFNFYREYASEYLGDIPLVFCGMNYVTPDDLKDINRVTGVNERADIEKNLQLIESIHNKVNTILIITDDTTTGLKIQEEVKRIEGVRGTDKPALELVHNISAEELKRKLGQLDDSYIVFLTVFSKDRIGEYFEYDKIVNIVSESSAVPVYGTWNFQLGEGIAGGYLVDGYSQGKTAAETIMSILRGTPIEALPVKYETPTLLKFDFLQLERFGIDLSLLPPGSIIINQTESVFSLYKGPLLITALLFLLLLMALAGVFYGYIQSVKAEKEVRFHEENLRTTLYSIGDAVISTDLQQRVVTMNPIAELLTGWLKEEAENKLIGDIFKIYHARNRNPIDSPIGRVLETGRIQGLPRHTLLIARDGREFKIADSAAPILDYEKKITGVVLVFRNISEEYRIQEQLVNERNYVKRIINNAPSLICGLDKDGITTFINPVIEKITGYREEEIIGRNFWKLFYPDEEFLQVKKLLHESMDGVVVDYEMTLTCKDGNKKTIVWNSFSRKDDKGSIVGYLGFGYDITELKAAERRLYETNIELVDHKNNLEELVADRTLELRISLDHLQEAQKKLVESEKMAALGGLVAGVAHEVNTPVGIGVTAASHLKDSIEEFESRYQSGKVTQKDFDSFLKLCHKSSEMILSNMNRAAHLILSFKQVAVDQSSRERRTFKINQYMKEILLSLHAQLRRKPYDVQLNCPEEFEVNSFPGALSQIITNLIMNSLNHGFEGMDDGSITIEIRKSDENALIIYGDTGCGIPDDNLDKIFDPFFTTKRGAGGSGLGMNIVYNLVTQSLKGQINCTSRIGQGTWFEIEFPINQT